MTNYKDNAGLEKEEMKTAMPDRITCRVNVTQLIRHNSKWKGIFAIIFLIAKILRNSVWKLK